MKKILVIIFVCIFTLNACNELNLNPLSKGSSESWYSNEEELDMSVAGIFHSTFWNAYAPITFFYNTDDYSRRTDLTVFNNGTLNGQSGEVNEAWNQAYRCIARANTLLESADKAQDIPQEKLKMYIGNARFARAVQYGKLIFHFGDVPYYEGTLSIEEAFQLGRKDKFEVLKDIYEDLDYAIEHLPVSYSSSEKEFVTKGTALALKARIALYMKDYIIARDAAKACMDLSVYKLFPDFSTLFLSKTRNSEETLFAVAHSEELGSPQTGYPVFDVVSRTAGGYGSRSPSWELLCVFLCTDGLPIDESPLFDPHDPFKNRDPRCNATIVEFGRPWLGYTYEPHPDSITVLNHSTGSYVNNRDCRTVDQYAAYNGLLWAKRVDEDWLDGSSNNDNIIMRYADVLLMYAEAKIELGEIDNSVLQAMNQVRARAYGVDVSEITLYPEITTTDQLELRKILRIERRMEFAMENCLRYNDIIRWRIAEKVLNEPTYGLLDATLIKEKIIDPDLWFFPETPSIDEDGMADFTPMYEKGLIRMLVKRVFDPQKHYLWPIPTTEILINENMSQNSGY